MIYETGSTVVPCWCGACYTLPQFRALPEGGIQEVDGARLELRECRCGSHLSIWIDADGRLTERPEWATGIGGSES